MNPREINDIVTNIFVHCTDTSDPFIHNEGIFSIFGSYSKSQYAREEIGDDVDILLILHAKEYPRSSIDGDRLILKYIDILNCSAHRLKQKQGVWVYQHVFLGLLAPPNTALKVHFLFYPTLLDALSVENPLLLRHILASIKPTLREPISTHFNYIIENMPNALRSLSLEEMYLRFIRMRAVTLLNTIVLNNLFAEKTKRLAKEMFKSALKYYDRARRSMDALPPLTHVDDQVEISYDLVLKTIKDILINTETVLENHMFTS